MYFIQKHICHNLYNQQGAAIVVTILILVLLSIIGTVALNSTHTELLIARNEKINTQAFYLAEAGIEQAKSNILARNETQPITNNLSNGNYTATFEPQEIELSNEEYVVNSTGRIENAKKIIQITFKKKDNFNYAIFSNGEVELKNNTITNGDVFANNNILTKFGSIVNGSIESANTITSNGICTGEIKENQSNQKTPSLEWSILKAEADHYKNGNYTFDGTEQGLWYVNGSVNFVSPYFSNNLSIIAENNIELKSSASTGINIKNVYGYPALASKEDIEIDSRNIDSELHGLIYSLKVMEIKGNSNIDIYGSLVTNSSAGNALELKDGNGTLNTIYKPTGGFNEGYKTTSWKELY